MYIKIENCQDRSIKIIDYPGSMRLFATVHSMGIYQLIIIGTGNAIGMVDRFTGEIHTIISKPSKKEIAEYKKGVNKNEINQKTN